MAMTYMPQRLVNGRSVCRQCFSDEMAHDVPNYHVDFAMRATHCAGRLPALGQSFAKRLFRDCLVDEMAHAAGRTPINTDAGC